VTLIPAPLNHPVAERSGNRQSAEAAGRRMAAQIPAPPTAGGDAVEAMARAALPRLREMGVVAEIVRARRDCLVVRSVAADPLAVAESCALVGGWLHALPEVAWGLAGTVAESTCATRGHRMCMHTLMWRAPLGLPGAAPAVELPAALETDAGASPAEDVPLPAGDLHPPTGASPTGGRPPVWGPPPAGPTLPEPLPDAAPPHPIPAASGLAPAAPLPPPSALLRSSPQRGFAPLRLGPGGEVQGGTAGPGSNGADRQSADHNGADQQDADHNGADQQDADHNGAARHGAGQTERGAEPSAVTTQHGTAGPGLGAEAPLVQGVPSEPPAARPQVRVGRQGARFGRAPWLRRRAWLLVLGLLAGAGGGYVAAKHGVTSYSASAVLEVQSSGTTNAVSSAPGAEQLAITYAALIPTDEALLTQVSAHLGTGASALAHSLSVEAVSGTALIDVRFSAGTASEAMQGANEVAAALTAAVPPGRAITPGSMSLVSTAQQAARKGSLHKYGMPIGVLLGLVVGAGATLVAERTDRRVDDADGLSAAAGCPATAEPGGISPAELASTLSAAGKPVIFVPLGAQEEPASDALGMRVAQAWPGRPPARTGDGDQTGPQDAAPMVGVAGPFHRFAQSPGDHCGRTVLVVSAGQRASAVKDAADRLRLLGLGPTWAVLVPRTGPAGPDDHGA
jgi:capsular polysaccharide biosynthesis protein